MLFVVTFIVCVFKFCPPFSIFTVPLYCKLESLIKTQAPAPIRGSVLGVVRTAELAVTVLGFPLLGWLFGNLSAGTAFAVIAAILTAVAAAFVWIAKGLRS